MKSWEIDKAVTDLVILIEFWKSFFSLFMESVGLQRAVAQFT